MIRGILSCPCDDQWLALYKAHLRQYLSQITYWQAKCCKLFTINSTTIWGFVPESLPVESEMCFNLERRFFKTLPIFRWFGQWFLCMIMCLLYSRMELCAKAHFDIVASVEIRLGHDRALIKSLQSQRKCWWFVFVLLIHGEYFGWESVRSYWSLNSYCGFSRTCPLPYLWPCERTKPKQNWYNYSWESRQKKKNSIRYCNILNARAINQLLL